MSWDKYIQACTELGFSKVTIVNRENFNVLASTQNDNPSSYIEKTGGGDSKEEELQVNENQELLDDWTDNKRATFRFYHQKFNILLRDEDGAYVVASQGQKVCIAYQFKKVWFVAYCIVQAVGGPEDAPKKAEENANVKELHSAPAAFDLLHKQVFKPMIESDI